ncbi:MAG: T9SS type A sorting domain-containing protein [Chitinophagales bacterium]|nr:T9SS type A sorting domain-containing protein [Chitinophagales bacterium]
MLQRIIWLFLLMPGFLKSQSVIGSWRTHHSYVIANGLALDKNQVFCNSPYAYFSVQFDNGEINTFSKSNGLSDAGVAAIGKDTTNDILVVVYNNSNIDILKNGKIINLPDIKNKSITGDKTIYHVFATNGIAYLSAGFGLVKLDLIKEEISDTYYPGTGTTNKVNASWATSTSIFCATENGVYKGDIAPGINLSNPADWQAFDLSDGIPSASSSAICVYDNQAYAAVGNSVYSYDGTDWQAFYTENNWQTKFLNIGNNKMVFSQWKYNGSDVVESRIVLFDGVNFEKINASAILQRPTAVAIDNQNRVWYADLYVGLNYFSNGNTTSILPNGPYAETVGKIDVMNGSIYAASAPIITRWDPLFNGVGFYVAKDYFWETFRSNTIPELNGLLDIGTVKTIPSENKVLYGAFYHGLIEFDPAARSVQVTEKAISAANNKFTVTGFAEDNQGNIWMSNAYTTAPIAVRKPGGSLTGYTNTLLNNKLIKDIAVDDNNQLWLVNNGVGLVVYNTNNTIDDPSDDNAISYTTSVGAGGLHTNAVTCIVKDAEGELWIGTEEGISVVRCPFAAFDRQCDAERICVPRGDTSNFCDYLLEDENIRCILVDPANRKWIGTNNGLFLISADGLKTIHYFNEDNSPLISNKIKSLAFEPNSGDLYIGTEIGIQSYRTDATLTANSDAKPFVYPNPVREDYNGPIAIKNLPNNAQVKITTVSGKLVYETIALGGQAIWDGNLLSGEKAASGVYLVFAVNDSGKEKAVTKFVLIH